MFKKSFYDWCKENNSEHLLDRWDYELNDVNPEDVSCSDLRKIFFLCENGLHNSEAHRLYDIKRYAKIPGCSVCGSFGVWCEKNNRLDFLRRWDYEANKISPYEVSISSTKKMYFKCPRGIHDSELKDLNNMRKQYKSGICIQCDSIGQFLIDTYGENAIEKYWSEKNSSSPFFISKRTHSKIWIKCQDRDYHPDYDLSASNFFAGKRCPYCVSKRICKEDSLGFLYPKSLEVWNKKNKLTPYDYAPMSNKKMIWHCENGIHEDYARTICGSTERDFRCPKCSKERQESLLQEKVRTYLESIFKDVRHEHYCRIMATNPETNYPLPYDNEVVDLNLIIEVHGEQHYKVSAYTYFNSRQDTPEESLDYRKRLDKLKKDYAINKGYHFLEIPYWTDDKKETWKKIIDKKISKIGFIAS